MQYMILQEWFTENIKEEIINFFKGKILTLIRTKFFWIKIQKMHFIPTNG
jgi:hypothetical protein